MGRDLTGKDGGQNRKVTRGGTCHYPPARLVLTGAARRSGGRGARAPARASTADRLGGRGYQATQPGFVSAHDPGPLVRSAFGPLERASFRMLGIRQFMTVRIVSADP